MGIERVVQGSAALAAAVVLLTTGGCAAASRASSLYNNASAAYHAKSAYSDVKDMQAMQPVFSGMTAVVVGSTLASHDSQNSVQINAAFQNSMAGIVRGLAGEMGQPLAVCTQTQGCGGRVLSVQFAEEAFDANVVEKVTMGSELKGKLIYVDLATGQVLATKSIEGVSSYADALGLIRGSIGLAMMKSYGKALKNEQFSRVPAVQPGYEKLLQTT